MIDEIISKAVDVHCHIVDDKDAIEKLTLNPPRISNMYVMSAKTEDFELVKEIHLKNTRNTFPCFGVHPWFVHHYKVVEEEDERNYSFLEMLEAYVKEFKPNCIVGEIGVDKKSLIPGTKVNDIKFQWRCFEKQWDIACKYNLCVSVHCVKAHGNLYEFLRNLDEERTPKNIMLHSYCGSQESVFLLLNKLPEYVSSKIYFSFSSVVNQRFKDTRKLIAMIPVEKILFESDLHLVEQVDNAMKDILQITSEVLNKTLEEVVEISRDNSARFLL
jgi:TatD DNase family protein